MLKATLIAPASERLNDIEADAHLDPDIRFRAPLSRHPVAPAHVFLTGATGLVGIYLLEELLRTSGATVHCLVRASDPEAAFRRLADRMRVYGLWRDEFTDRIRAVPGDVSEPRLGLTHAAFRELAEVVDAIYHSAGSTNMALPYSRLKPTNVLGTEEVLRLAGTVTTKPVHFLSSIAVFYTDAYANGVLLKESATPCYHESMKGGYSRSKWVAERLVEDARRRGLPACIYRPVRILGHSRTGALNEMNDILPLLLRACVLLGKYPAFDLQVTLVPVDYVSRAMVHVASREDSWGNSFHLFNPRPVEWRRLLEMLGATGYPLVEVPYDEWWRDLKQELRNSADTPGRREFLSAVTMAMTAPHFLFYKRPTMDSGQIDEALRGSGIECPRIDQALIDTYAAAWRESRFLPEF